MTVGSIHQEGITVVIYIHSISEYLNILSKYQQIWREIDNNTLIVRNISTPLLTVGKSSRQKINREIVDLNHILDQMDLADRYRHSIQTAAEYTSQSCVEHSLAYFITWYKINLSQFEKIEVIQCNFPIIMVWNKTYKRRRTEIFTNMWKLAHSWATSESKKESNRKLRNILKKMKMEIQYMKIYGMWQ